MRFPLFDAPPREPSQFVGFAGNTIDRRSENRSDDSATKALADPAARLLVVRGGRIYLKMNGGGFDPYYSVAQAARLEPRLDRAVLLGWSEHGPVLAAPAGVEPDELGADVKAIDFRSVYMQGLLDASGLGQLAQAGAMLAWHSTHRFCGACGAATEMRSGGYKRVCPGCGREHFPRTDPVVIMLAVTRERCLLGRSPHFAPGMYSTLAGFVEPGETIENAVRREVGEEAGIRLGRIAYHASQPWPFPYSLMIGCFGEALDEVISYETTELEDCRWFTRNELKSVLAGENADGIVAPPKGAIASDLMTAWAQSD